MNRPKIHSTNTAHTPHSTPNIRTESLTSSLYLSPTTRTLRWFESRRIPPLILPEIKRTCPLRNQILQSAKTPFTFPTFLPILSPVRLREVESTNRVPHMIPQTRDAGVGERLVGIFIIADSALAAFRLRQVLGGAAEAAVGFCRWGRRLLVHFAEFLVFGPSLTC
jgi:hypothetical protein